MADLKISQLPAATTPLTGAELVPLVQGGVTDQTTVGDILTSTVPSGTANGVLYLNGSKVATSGSGLTFDGSTFAVTGALSATESITTDKASGAFGFKINSSGYGTLGQFGVVNAGTDNTTWIGSVSNNGFQIRTNNNVVGTFDASGNLGLGVTPSAWSTTNGYLGLQVGTYCAISNYGSLGGGIFTSNAYAYGLNTYRYLQSYYAAMYKQGAGTHSWYSAPSGTAGQTTTVTNGRNYTITAAGGTNYTSFGAANNNVGTTFTATSGGTGDGGGVTENIQFTQAMTLDASGNLLVGITTAGGKVCFGGAVSDTWATAAGGLIINGCASSPGVSTITTYYDDTSIRIGAGVSNKTGLFINGSAASGGSHVSISTGGAECARIDTNGYLLVGYTTSNGAYKLQVNSQIFATSSTIATSDGRYKENVQTLDSALDVVKALRPVQFDWKPHPVHAFDTANTTTGFIAQEVQQALADKPYLNSIIKSNTCTLEPAEYETVEVTPAVAEVKDENGDVITEAVPAVTEQRLIKEAVTEEFLGIAEGNMIAILTKAIQELETRLAALEAA